MLEKEIKERLLKENKDFKKIYEFHQECEKKLKKFQQKSYLSEEEKLEEKELKKKKLSLKDKMYYLMTQYRKSLR